MTVLRRDGWRQARLETILDLSLALGGPRQEREVVEEFAHRAVGLLDARAGFAASLLPHLEPALVVTVGWTGGGDHATRLITAPSLAPVREGRSVLIHGEQVNLPFGEILVAPSLWREDLIGVVAVADKEGRAGRLPFDEEDGVFLRSLALLAAPAIASCRALEEVHRRRLLLEEENRELRGAAGTRSGLVGRSPAFRRVLELVSRVAPTDVTVLLRGESGTGKERIARLLHELSSRRDGPFVALNCAAVPETLLEAELFGIEAGVATGVSARVGKVELAHGGTLFLDEVGDLSAVLQAKVLRVIQEREVERVGGRRALKVDVRLITATNRDLEAMIAEGGFREDLYYRLRVVELMLPPLRERREDVPLLAQFFLDQHARRQGREVTGWSREALELLLAHEYPGNVRELENLLEAAVALAPGPRIEAEDLRLALGGSQPIDRPAGGTLEEVVQKHVANTLERCKGNRAAAARELGIDRATLYRMIKRQNATNVAKRTSPKKGRQNKDSSVRVR